MGLAGSTRDWVSIASQVRAANTRGPAAGPSNDVAREGTLQGLNTAQGRFETRGRGLKDGFGLGGGVQTPQFRAIGFSEDPIKAGRRPVSKRTLRLRRITLNVHIGEALAAEVIETTCFPCPASVLLAE